MSNERGGPGNGAAQSPEVAAARRIALEAEELLHRSRSFQQLAPATQAAIVRDLGIIRRGLHAGEEPAGAPAARPADPFAFAMETPFERVRRGPGGGATPGESTPGNGTTPVASPGGPRQAATETLAARAGALTDEIDFPAFVAGLVHSTFDAIVEASIRQMEAFADLVSAVAKDVDQFTRENITTNQVRDWLRDRYPADLTLEVPRAGQSGEPRLRARPLAGEGDEVRSPGWLSEYGLEGEELGDELIEEQLVPLARKRLGESRLQMLATMVLLGMNRVNVKDGTIAAKVRFRAAARDVASVDYAVNSDVTGGAGGRSNWGSRGSLTYPSPSTMVSTVGVNVQADSELKAELFGEVRINFVSETLPLEKFVDAAALQLLQANARTSAQAPAAALPAATQPVAPAAAPAAAQPAVATPGGSA